MHSFKVSVIGESGVGKTSLVYRFLFGGFPDRPVATLVSNVQKQVVRIELPFRAPEEVELVLWDIMGDPKIRDLLRDAFFVRAAALVAVCDVTRPQTVTALDDWLAAARSVAGEIPTTIVANKVDLPRVVEAAALEVLCARTGASLLFTSAKTGEGVGPVFEDLARRAWAQATDARSGAVPRFPAGSFPG